MLTGRERERLKVAQMLEQRLPKAAHTALFPPDYYWDRFCQAAARVNQAYSRGWSGALPFALEELERRKETLVQQLRAVTDLARVQMAPRPRATLSEILADLIALEDDFPEVRWNLRDKTLTVVTEPVVLKDIELGPFALLLEIRHLGQTRPYRVVALEPNPAAGEASTTHPHVRSDDLCEGEGKGPIQKALRQGRFHDLFVLINRILFTYNSDSAYVPLGRWQGSRCLGCGSTVSDDDSVTCDSCGDESCSECTLSCAKCGCSLCGSCRSHCGMCGDILCRSCLTRCASCRDDYCASCLEADRCEDCQERNTDDEIEAEDQVSADAEVQPLRVGEAPVPQGSGTH